MRLTVTASLLAICLILSAGCASQTEPLTPLAAAPAAAPAVAIVGRARAASRSGRQVAIPYEKFTLDNGLTVLVNEDRKTPVVAVGIWYNVGSKDEPKGKTGFAHLFEHLMFYGSDNLREGIMGWLEKIGATDWNGSTWYDRTNYYQTVPKSALEKVLFMESDRMGYLLPAIDQKRLDLQRGVVQNEKRQRDNAPGGLVGYAVSEALLPEGHPYRHSTIGSMADLDAASLADVKQWFIDKYGPNNAVLVLSGEIDAAEARPLVEKYFGAIPRGAVNVPAAADVPTLDAPKRLVLKDRVAATSIQRYWVVPGTALRRTGRARCRRVDPRRPGEQPARPDPGPRREDRGRRVGRLPAIPAARQFHRHRDGQARRRPGAGREKARRDHCRLSRQRAERGGNPARRDGRGRAAHPKPRKDRRRRQDREARRRLSLQQRSDVLPQGARQLCRADAGKRALEPAALDRPARR